MQIDPLMMAFITAGPILTIVSLLTSEPASEDGKKRHFLGKSKTSIEELKKTARLYIEPMTEAQRFIDSLDELETRLSQIPVEKSFFVKFFT